MSKKRGSIIASGIVLLIVVALVWGYVSLTGPHGKVVARLQQKDEGGYIHSVTVREFGGRFNTELSEEGRPVRDLPVSSYAFYEGSDPITAATHHMAGAAQVHGQLQQRHHRGVFVEWDECCVDETLIVG